MLRSLAYITAFVGFCTSCYSWIATEKWEDKIDAKVTAIVCLIIMEASKETGNVRRA